MLIIFLCFVIVVLGLMYAFKKAEATRLEEELDILADRNGSLTNHYTALRRDYTKLKNQYNSLKTTTTKTTDAKSNEVQRAKGRNSKKKSA